MTIAVLFLVTERYQKIASAIRLFIETKRYQKVIYRNFALFCANLQ